EAGGGQNILGLQENAAESGKAVRARQSAAGLSRVPLYYNLQQWKKDTITTILWYIRNYSSEDQLRLILEDPRVGAAFEYKPGIYNTLKSIETDVAITIATDTETARQEVYNQILQMLNSGLAASLDPKTLLTLLVEMNPYLTEEVKNKIYSTDAIAGQIRQQLAVQQE
ncbi:MAG: hypothetical protein NZ481_10165, partial [Candidatus Kapabacteria bacterium]|nr:hypothetical protein [Candidatus Kapabacteria bacterium]